MVTSLKINYCQGIFCLNKQGPGASVKTAPQGFKLFQVVHKIHLTEDRFRPVNAFGRGKLYKLYKILFVMLGYMSDSTFPIGGLLQKLKIYLNYFHQ